MKYKRLTSGIFLIIVLTLLMVYSGYEYNNQDPDIDYIIKNYEKFNNTRITIKGEIEKINTSKQQITVITPPTPYKIIVETEEITENMQKGNLVEILGILNGKNHVTAEKFLIVERWKSDLIIIRSLPAIPFALYLFFRTWRFNKKTYRFERRKKDA